ncbi:MAG: methyltransferase [Clostridia bacterium]|nr:methyltransferase [Clostridia bacterium]
MELFENERCDEVNDRLRLIQRTDGLTFGTDALLLAAYIGGGYKSAVELGGGTGIVSMLAATREKAARVLCAEVQPEFAELIRRNIELNSLRDKITVHEGDIRDLTPEREAELVFSNPPYMKTDTGRANLSGAKNIARHEVFGSIADFTTAAARLVKYGGDAVFVYRTDRACDLIYEMRRARLEPKRLTLVYADAKSEPSMLLVEGRRGGGVGLKLTRPLIIYTDPTHTAYGMDMEYIMNTGYFPKEFYR